MKRSHIAVTGTVILLFGFGHARAQDAVPAGGRTIKSTVSRIYRIADQDSPPEGENLVYVQSETEEFDPRGEIARLTIRSGETLTGRQVWLRDERGRPTAVVGYDGQGNMRDSVAMDHLSARKIHNDIFDSQKVLQGSITTWQNGKGFTVKEVEQVRDHAGAGPPHSAPVIGTRTVRHRFNGKRGTSVYRFKREKSEISPQNVVLVSSENDRGRGKRTTVRRYEYSYVTTGTDARGNWTGRITYEGDLPVEVTLREIEYY